MRQLARRDITERIKELIEIPLGTKDGEQTPDSIAYIAELRRILARMTPRVR